MTRNRVMIHRKAVTLTEVLISIFVMALGLLSLLALFPVGALTVAQAVKDDRTAHLAYTADAIARFQNLRVDPQIVQQNPSAVPPGTPLWNYYSNPGGGLPALDPLVTAGTYAGPSYPVYVDPVGVQAFSASAWSGNVGGNPALIPRRSV